MEVARSLVKNHALISALCRIVPLQYVLQVFV